MGVYDMQKCSSDLTNTSHISEIDKFGSTNLQHVEKTNGTRPEMQELSHSGSAVQQFALVFPTVAYGMG
jgi:hypothetical protein